MVILLLYITIIILIVYVFQQRKTRSCKHIPGPKGWPLAGYAPCIKKGAEHETFSNLVETHGEIFKITIFGQTIVVLNSVPLIRSAFSSQKYKKCMNDRITTFIGEHLFFGNQSIAFMLKAYDSDHRNLRKMFAQGMNIHGEGKQDFEDKMKIELLNLMDRFDQLKGQKIDMNGVLKRSLTNVMSVFLAGHDLKDEDEDLNMFWDFNEWSDYFSGAGAHLITKSFAFLRFIPGIYKAPFDKLQQSRETILRRFFHEKRATYKDGTIRGIVDFLIREQLEAQTAGRRVLLTDERIMAMTLESVGAGILTTFSSISSLFLCLLNYPDYQVKIQAELDRVVGRDRLPGLEDRQACVFTEAVLLETQRYLTTVPLLGPHFCEKGAEFEGFEIPPKSVIIPNVWHIHHDKAIWEDPWTFRPERWLDESGNLLPNDHKQRKNLMAFGVGRRQCPGESLARSRIFLYVATLLQRWNFEMVPGHTVSCDPRRGHFNIGVVCRPKPYLCRVRQRQ